MIKIPKSFQMGGHTMRVVKDPGLNNRTGHVGEWRGATNVIAVDPDYPPSLVAETYIHELIEAANSLGELHLEHNVIQALGLLLHQALDSGKG